MSFSLCCRRWLRAAAILPLSVAGVASAAPPASPVPSPSVIAPAPWVAAWAAAPRDYNEAAPISGTAAPPPLRLQNQTVRIVLAPSLDGVALRVRLSNVFGRAPLHVGAASVAHAAGVDAGAGADAGALVPRTLQPLRFDGRPSVTIAPGAERWSDPVALPVAVRQPLAVSVFLPDPTRAATAYLLQPSTTWLATGDATARPDLRAAAARSDWGHVVTGLDVRGAPDSRPARMVVAFGDSITYGAGSATGQAGSYPTRLAQRLRELPTRVGVVNVGIGGNRLLADGMGPGGLARFERDVLAQSSVTHAIVLIGVNDIGFGTMLASAEPTTAQLATGLQALVDRARARGVKVLLGTLPPFKGSGYATDAAEARRQALNRWIRGRQRIDGVVDFDAVLRDPADAAALAPAFDSGDHLHPGEAGYAAMAAALDLRELLE